MPPNNLQNIVSRLELDMDSLTVSVRNLTLAYDELALSAQQIGGPGGSTFPQSPLGGGQGGGGFAGTFATEASARTVGGIAGSIPGIAASALGPLAPYAIGGGILASGLADEAIALAGSFIRATVEGAIDSIVPAIQELGNQQVLFEDFLTGPIVDSIQGLGVDIAQAIQGINLVDYLTNTVNRILGGGEGGVSVGTVGAVAAGLRGGIAGFIGGSLAERAGEYVGNRVGGFGRRVLHGLGANYGLPDYDPQAYDLDVGGLGTNFQGGLLGPDVGSQGAFGFDLSGPSIGGLPGIELPGGLSGELGGIGLPGGLPSFGRQDARSIVRALRALGGPGTLAGIHFGLGRVGDAGETIADISQDSALGTSLTGLTGRSPRELAETTTGGIRGLQRDVEGFIELLPFMEEMEERAELLSLQFDGVREGLASIGSAGGDALRGLANETATFSDALGHVAQRLRDVFLEISVIRPFQNALANIVGGFTQRFISNTIGGGGGGSTSNFDPGIAGGVSVAGGGGAVVNLTVNDADPSRAYQYTDSALAAAQDAQQIGAGRVSSPDYAGGR